jgi:uncharacterized protein YacL
MLKKWLKYSFAYIGWIVFIALGFLFLVLGRTSFSGLLNAYYVQGKYQRSVEVQFIDRVFFLIVAFALLISMIVVEEYFKNGVKRERLPGRIFRVMGIEILLVFIAHFALVFPAGFPPLTIFLLLAELIAGAAMAWFGFRLPVK